MKYLSEESAFDMMKAIAMQLHDAKERAASSYNSALAADDDREVHYYSAYVDAYSKAIDMVALMSATIPQRANDLQSGTPLLVDVMVYTHSVCSKCALVEHCPLNPHHQPVMDVAEVIGDRVSARCMCMVPKGGAQ